MYAPLTHFIPTITKVSVFLLVIGFAIYGISTGEVRFSDEPAWQADLGSWPAGVAWGDIDGNGWLDLVTGVGIDVGHSSDKVYFNYDGELSTTAGWVSEYIEHSNMVQLGDLDNDGDLDMYVPGGGSLYQDDPHPDVIYYNDNGLPAYPDWMSEPLLVWSGDLGDPDGDGDLDIVVADCGSSYLARKVKMFYNNGGHFNTTHDWESDLTYAAVDAEFADIDLDGDLDLAITGLGFGIRIFYNHNGTIETSPSWATGSVFGGSQIAFGDIDGDGYLEMAVPGGISGGFHVFKNLNGTYNTTPMWSCFLYISCGVSWGDVDEDGDLDLAGCGWQNAPVGIFENIDGMLTDSYVWSVTVGGFPQLAIFADYDEDMLVETTINITADGNRKLYTLSEIPIHEITSIDIDGVPLDYSQYCYNREGGWISLASPPESGSTVSIHYVYSRDLDLAIGSSGAWVYNNQVSTLYFPTYSFIANEFVDDNDDGFYISGETVRFYFELNNEHTEDYNVTVTMTSSNPDIVFTNQSVFFPVIDGDNTTVNNFSDPIEYIIPDLDGAVYDTFFVSVVSDLGTYRDQFQFIQETGRAKVLLIDDDRGENYQDVFYNDLFALNTPSHIWTSDILGSPTVSNLSQYHTVVWFTGEDAEDCLQPDDITVMKDFLDDGGNLYLSGLGLAGELLLEEPTFLEDYLHSEYIVDRFSDIHIGLEESLFNGIQIRLSNPISIPGMERISAVNDGKPILKFNNTLNRYSAISFNGYNRVVFITWGYELISNDFIDEGFASRTEVMQRILDFFPDYRCGDVDGNRTVDLLDIVFMIDNKFKGGPLPDPIEAADVNSDGIFDLLDIVHMIDSKFKGGRDPYCLTI
jgi:hypothetical protein